jgi:hypothetical protein
MLSQNSQLQKLTHRKTIRYPRRNRNKTPRSNPNTVALVEHNKMAPSELRQFELLWRVVTRLDTRKDWDDLKRSLMIICGSTEEEHKDLADIDRILVILYGNNWKNLAREERKVEACISLEGALSRQEVLNDPLRFGVAQLSLEDVDDFDRIFTKLEILNGDAQSKNTADVLLQNYLIHKEEEERKAKSVEIAADDPVRRSARGKELRELADLYSKSWNELSPSQRETLATDLSDEDLKRAAHDREARLLEDRKDKVWNDHTNYLRTVSGRQAAAGEL